MKIAFLTEMGFAGKIPADHPNMRTEFAWMHALDADHYNIYKYPEISDYDHVFVIFPKGKTYLSSEGTRLADHVNPVSNLLVLDIISKLKQNNKQIHYVQEGPHWWFNDYEIADQINFFNMLQDVDSIYAHNEFDANYYRGLCKDKPVTVIPTLMIETLIKNIKPTSENKVIIGGNFARWYGGFESYIVAQEFDSPIWGQTSHAMRDSEDQLFNHLPRVTWIEWMQQLSQFKYAVHLMPTVAAGTFSLNCAYFGIPCIGNIKVDTQRLCHPELSVDVSDIEQAVYLANKLKTDLEFYSECSNIAKQNYNHYYNIETWKNKINLGS
jgi:uncharacterized membrane protein YfbV (UPF0208 family)